MKPNAHIGFADMRYATALTVAIATSQGNIEELRRERQNALERYLRDLTDEFDAIETEAHSEVLERITANWEKMGHRRKRPMTNREADRKQDLIQLWYSYQQVHMLLAQGRKYLKASISPPRALTTRIRIAAKILADQRRAFSDRSLRAIKEGQITQLRYRVKDSDPVRRELEAYHAANPNLSYWKATESKELCKKVGLRPRTIRDRVPKSTLDWEVQAVTTSTPE